MDADVHVTIHAEERLRKRYGLQRGSVFRMARKAYNEGLTQADTKGKLRRYVNSIYLKSEYGMNNVRIYGHYIFLFNNISLVTVYQLPHLIRHIALKLQRKKNGSK